MGTHAENRQERWDRDYLSLARFWAERKSKDPSTKVGAVIVDDQLTVRSLGYNGFPRGVEDTPERLRDRELKYELVVHAEMNALLTAHASVRGCTLYAWPLPSCSNCAKMIIQAGIRRVVFPPLEGDVQLRWATSWARAYAMYKEAGVEVSLVSL